MRKLFSNKKFVIVLLVVLVLAASLWVYNARQESQVPVSGYSIYGVESPMAGLDPLATQLPVDGVVEVVDGVVLYEIKLEMEDLNLASEFPSFVKSFAKDGEEALDVKNYIFDGWGGLLRGSLVSVPLGLEWFSIGDVLIVEIENRDLSMTVPGDVVTLYCEVELPVQICVGDAEEQVPSCLEFLELENCSLVRISHP